MQDKEHFKSDAPTPQNFSGQKIGRLICAEKFQAAPDFSQKRVKKFCYVSVTQSQSNCPFSR